jgi:hypothetical protein
LTRILGSPFVEELDDLRWRWTEPDILDEPVEVYSLELVTWVWGKLTLAEHPVLDQFRLLSAMFPQGSPEAEAFMMLRETVRDGTSMFGADGLLPWEALPTLSPLAAHLKLLCDQGAVKDFAAALFSFCPWAEEYESARKIIKEWGLVHAWSALKGNL